MLQTIEDIFVGILNEDRMTASAAVLDHVRSGLLNAAKERPASDAGIARLAELSDEQIEIGVRGVFEPMARKALAMVRPS